MNKKNKVQKNLLEANKFIALRYYKFFQKNVSANFQESKVLKDLKLEIHKYTHNHKIIVYLKTVTKRFPIKSNLQKMVLIKKMYKIIYTLIICLFKA